MTNGKQCHYTGIALSPSASLCFYLRENRRREMELEQHLDDLLEAAIEATKYPARDSKEAESYVRIGMAAMRLRKKLEEEELLKSLEEKRLVAKVAVENNLMTYEDWEKKHNQTKGLNDAMTGYETRPQTLEELEATGLPKPVFKIDFASMDFMNNGFKIEPIVMPRNKHSELRTEELTLGVKHNLEKGYAIPIEWIEEYNELVSSKL